MDPEPTTQTETTLPSQTPAVPPPQNIQPSATPLSHTALFITMVALLIVALFTPTPYYREVLCKPYAADCPAPGWVLGDSLFTRLLKNLTQPSIQTTVPAYPTTEPSPTSLPSEWKIYTNTAYHYSVSYPSTWQTNTGDNGVTTNFFLQSTDPEFISVTVHENKNTTEIHQWLIDRSIVPNPNNIATHIGEENLVVNGIPSVKVTTPVNGGQFTIYIPKGNMVYSIYNNLRPNTPSTMDAYNQNVEIMNKMVSTFTFFDTKPNVAQAKQACITMQVTEKYWDDLHVECREGGATKEIFQEYCTKYNGKFVDNADTCRYSREMGQPCGPQATYYCSFK